MRHVKRIYWVLIAIWMVLLIAGMFVFKWDAAFFLSGLAIAISILAIGLSDQFIPKFDGRIDVWTSRIPGNDHRKLSMRIENRASYPIYDVLVKVRGPLAVLGDQSSVQSHSHGKTNVFVDDSFGILGRAEDTDYLHYDFQFFQERWTGRELGYIYITISGSNIDTTTCKIRQDQMDLLLEATSQRPLKNGRELEQV